VSDIENAGPSLSDELAVRNVLNRVALLADRDSDDLEAYLACWTEDAIWKLPDRQLEGRDAIRKGALGRRQDSLQGPGTHTRHVVTNQVIEFEGADVATSQAYMIFFTDTDTTAAVGLVAHHQDTLVRTDDGWKLAKRVIDFS